VAARYVSPELSRTVRPHDDPRLDRSVSGEHADRADHPGRRAVRQRPARLGGHGGSNALAFLTNRLFDSGRPDSVDTDPEGSVIVTSLFVDGRTPILQRWFVLRQHPLGLRCQQPRLHAWGCPVRC